MRTTIRKSQHWQPLVVAVLLAGVVSPHAEAGLIKKNKKTPEQLRQEYITRLQEKDAQAPARQTVGSLWVQGASLGDLSTDFKAQKLNDPIVILVAVQTTAAQSGDSSYQRAFQTSSRNHRSARRPQDQRREYALQCQLRDGTQRAGSNRFEHQLPNQPHRAGDCDHAQRQSGSRSAAQDLHEQSA